MTPDEPSRSSPPDAADSSQEDASATGTDRDRAQNRAAGRQSDRAGSTEAILESVEDHLGDAKYPISSEELAREYGSQPLDLPNETESLGSVLDRLVGEEFESPEEAREAIYGELTGTAGDRREANPERDLEALDDGRADASGNERR